MPLNDMCCDYPPFQVSISPGVGKIILKKLHPNIQFLVGKFHWRALWTILCTFATVSLSHSSQRHRFGGLSPVTHLVWLQLSVKLHRNLLSGDWVARVTALTMTPVRRIRDYGRLDYHSVGSKIAMDDGNGPSLCRDTSRSVARLSRMSRGDLPVSPVLLPAITRTEGYSPDPEHQFRLCGRCLRFSLWLPPCPYSRLLPY